MSELGYDLKVQATLFSHQSMSNQVSCVLWEMTSNTTKVLLLSRVVDLQMRKENVKIQRTLYVFFFLYSVFQDKAIFREIFARRSALP